MYNGRSKKRGKTREREEGKTNRETEKRVFHKEDLFMPATVKGAVLSWAAMTSSFLRIHASPMPHLPPQAEFQAREWVKETGTRCATAAQNRQIWKHDYLPVIVSIFVAACIVPQYSPVKDPHQLAEEEKKKSRISQLNGETPAGRGRNSRLAGESDIIQVWTSMFL